MMPLIISFILIALYWMHDIHWPPAYGFWLAVRVKTPKIACRLQSFEDLWTQILFPWLTLAAGLDYVWRLLHG
jgi:hypothetical protein